MKNRTVALFVGASLVLLPVVVRSEALAVRYAEGSTRGFLSLSTLEGEFLAYGDLSQSTHGDRVTKRLVFHFKDGSIHDESVVYSQRRTFRLLIDHVTQSGPSFPHPTDVLVDNERGQVSIRYKDADGKAKVVVKHMSLPADVANGLVLTLIKNIERNAKPATVSVVAATPEPLLVKIRISLVGEEPFSIGGSPRKALHYVVKVELGGVTGVVAPLVGRQPADSHVWILGGEAPAFLKAEGPLSPGGPPWRIELLNPVWSSTPARDGTVTGAKN